MICISNVALSPSFTWQRATILNENDQSVPSSSYSTEWSVFNAIYILTIVSLKLYVVTLIDQHLVNWCDVSLSAISTPAES